MPGTTKITKSPKRKLADMSVEEMMAADFDSDDEELESGDEEGEEAAAEIARGKKDVKGSQSRKPTAISKHKQSMENLKKTDPEFFEFLQENDGNLLEFNESDDSEMSSDEDEEEDQDKDEEEEEEEEEDEELELELDDGEEMEDEWDDSSGEELGDDDERETKDQRQTVKRVKFQVTLDMVDKWRHQLENKSMKALKELMKAFRAAVQQSGSDDQLRTKYNVESSTVFNAVVSLCLKQVQPVLQHALGLEDKPNKLPSTAPRWRSHHMETKAYLADVVQLLSNVSEPIVVSAVLRHMRSLIPFYTCFPKLTKVVIKKLINLWSTGEETVRVLAFLNLFAIIRCTKQARLDFILKQMYLAYVRNTKFTSPSTLPVINFMQRSLTEMFALNTQVTYQHAFVYIRQLAIHLRNAITVKKKDMYQSVYNWQYIHCVSLWCRVLATLHSDEILKPLVYPLVQTSVGVIKLIPAERYYPLRFHVVRALNLLSEATGTFIPLLPFILEVLQITDFNKKHVTSSFRPLNFAVMLRLSNSQLKERGFKDGVIDQVYDLLVEHLQVHAHRIGFPELALPVVLELKSFVKKCKVANFTRLLKALLDKVLENCQEITKRREKVTFGLADVKAVSAWEEKIKEEGTALTKFYQTYKKLRERELKHLEAGKERLIDDKIPTMTQSKKRKMESKMELKGLFRKDFGSDDEEDLFKRVERKQKRTKPGGRRDDDDGELEDLDEDDFAGLSEDSDKNCSDREIDVDRVGKGKKAGKEKGSASSTKKTRLSKGDVIQRGMREEEDKGDIVEDFQMWSDEEDAKKPMVSKKRNKTAQSKNSRKGKKKSPHS